MAGLLRIVMLLLPALIPSWRFFKTVAPSPRVEFRILPADQSSSNAQWCEFRPRPATLSIWQMLRRMVWNPVWNEQLFLVSCAERLIANPTQHSIDEINSRIWADIASSPPRTPAGSRLQFRLVFVCREGAEIVKYVDYESQPIDPYLGVT
ncbi:hypothetical protein [Aestuariibius sp. HNIBRBA575]|uniref:hypothetical protein n=1 Tax=Aestuariibius sp. HNIBRBA575 TaxID=3233343 RepID=UPI0034A3A594